jgi:hypothetical protein
MPTGTTQRAPRRRWSAEGCPHARESAVAHVRSTWSEKGMTTNCGLRQKAKDTSNEEH